MIGRFAHRYGTRRLLWLGSVGIVPLPCLWLVSHHFAWLFALQLLSGMSWAAFELATLLSFFEHIPQNARTSILSVYNLAYATAIVGGGAIGGAILDVAGRGPGAYVILLVTSSVARGIGLTMLRGAPNVVPRETKPPAMRTLGVRPSAGAFQRPVLPTLEEDEPETSAGPPAAARSA
jgi:MFS family permease